MVQRIHIDRGATIFKQGSCWYLDFNSNGIRSRTALHTRMRDHAITIARDLVQETLSQQWGIPLPKDISFAKFLEIYREYSTSHNAPNTTGKNLLTLRRFQKHAALVRTKSSFTLADVTPDLVESYKTSRKSEGISAATVNRDLAVISVFFNLAKERNLARVNPIARVRSLPVIKKRVPKTLTSDQVVAILKGAEKPIPNHGPGKKGNGTFRNRKIPLHDMILFAVNTGARLGEILHLEWDDVDLSFGLVSFRCKPEHTLKDREERRVKTNEEVLGMLRRRKLAAGSGRWVFPSSVGTVLRRENALRQLKLVAKRVNVPQATFQMLRRTFATMAARSGVPSFVLREVLGHSSVKTTEGYYIGAAGGSAWTPPIIG